MDVSIIYVNYKTKDLTINSIKSVIEKTEGIEYEIFVIDNNSQDGSIEEIEKEFPNVHIIKSSVNAGFGAGNNLGIKQAKGKYILCLNTDTLLINNAIKKMFEYMEEYQNVGVCGGILYDKDNNPIHSGGMFPSFQQVALRYFLLIPAIHKWYAAKYYNNQNYDKLEYVTGADIFFRKSVLDKVGIFDETFFMYCEEAELCYRIKKAGYKINFVKDAKIMHLEGMSSNNNVKKFMYGRNSEYYFYKKHFPNRLLFLKITDLIVLFFNGYILKDDDKKEMFKALLTSLKSKRGKD